ncbi:MAG: hypothetical protein K6C40_08620 [Thermoguttaceae bacterium]|nr:hypothetical protein [Thermoguttaceae bacterium]
MKAAVFLDLDGTLIFNESDLNYWNIRVQTGWTPICTQSGSSYYMDSQTVSLLKEMEKRAHLFLITGRNAAQFDEVSPWFADIQWGGVWGKLGEMVLQCRDFRKNDYETYLARKVPNSLLQLYPGTGLENVFSVEFREKELALFLNKNPQVKRSDIYQTSRKRFALTAEGFGKHLPVKFIKSLNPNWFTFGVGDMTVDIPMLSEVDCAFAPSSLSQPLPLHKIDLHGPEFTFFVLSEILNQLKVSSKNEEP